MASSADGNRLVAVVNGGQIQVSNDAGASWTARESNRNWYAVASLLGLTRRFVKEGGRSQRWKGVGMQHGQHARANLNKAVAEKLPIFGFEAEPNKAALERGERSVKHFYLDRAHQLQGRIGLSLYELETRLHVEDAFRQREVADEEDPNLPASLFELVDATVEPPAAGDHQIEGASEEHEVDLPLEGNQSADVYGRCQIIANDSRNG